MEYRIEFSVKAIKTLKELPYKTKERIYNKVVFYSKSPNPLKFAKQLEGDKEGQYRFRIGDYRVIFEVINNDRIIVLYILSVGHRKDIYK